MSTPLFLSIPLTLISVLGLLFNGYIITAVLLTRQATSANNILLLHLGAVDTLLGLLFLIFSVPGFTKAGWLVDGIPCLLHGFLYTLLHPIALWTICGLNCDRYYAIAAPLHYGHIVSQKKVLFGLGVGWIITLILCIPPFISIAPYNYIAGLGACAPNFANGIGTLWYSTLYTAFTLLLPATLIICCNLKILMIARYHRHRIASAIYEVTLSAQVTITHQRNPFFVPTVTAPSSGGPKFRGRSAINTVFQLVGSLILLYVPFYCLIIWEAAISTDSIKEQTTKQHHPHFITTVTALLTCSPFINGFLYGIKSKPLRKTFQNYWRKKQTKSEVNQEIQARTPSTCGSRRPSLTPLGFLTKPTLQRRLSEALLDVHKVVSNSSPQKQKIKRIATELTWRPASVTNLMNLSSSSPPTTTTKDEVAINQKIIKHTNSCNTLQVPINDSEQVATITEDELFLKIAQKQSPSSRLMSTSAANLLFQKIFRRDPPERRFIKKTTIAVQNVLLDAPATPPKKSPTITITRAFSEDNSDKSSSQPSSPSSKQQQQQIIINKKHSMSPTNLFERKWRQLRNDGPKKSTPLLLDSLSNRSSDSSDNDTSSSNNGDGRIFMTLDNNKSLIADTGGDSEASEDQLLLTRSSQKKIKINEDTNRKPSIKPNNNKLIKQSLIGNVQSHHEIIL